MTVAGMEVLVGAGTGIDVGVGVSATVVGVAVGVASLAGVGVGVPVGVASLAAVGLDVGMMVGVWVGEGVSNWTNLTRVMVGLSLDALSGLPQASTGKNSSRPMKMDLKYTDNSFENRDWFVEIRDSISNLKSIKASIVCNPRPLSKYLCVIETPGAIDRFKDMGIIGLSKKSREINQMDYTAEEKANMREIIDTLDDIRSQLIQLRQDHAQHLFTERLFLEGLERAIAGYLYEKYADEEIVDDDTFQDFSGRLDKAYGVDEASE